MEVLGLHRDTHGHDEEHSTEEKEYLWRILAVVAGIYGFFLIERIFSLFSSSRGHVSVLVFAALQRFNDSLADFV